MNSRFLGLKKLKTSSRKFKYFWFICVTNLMHILFIEYGTSAGHYKTCINTEQKKT